ncbi:MAG: helical backbone metal receptor [Deltaproteobacteria bacterium]|jgi:iron complex transport system substrate-binding protein|nr:helical backbone metal receptor [Deltaproteobacteria bacterium]
MSDIVSQDKATPEGSARKEPSRDETTPEANAGEAIPPETTAGERVPEAPRASEEGNYALDLAGENAPKARVSGARGVTRGGETGYGPDAETLSEITRDLTGETLFNSGKLKTALLVLLLLAGLALTVRLHNALAVATSPKPIPENPQRIVTLAPSVTETVFAAGLGPEVIGVTTFCRYPPEVLSLPKVAGFSDVNVEAILRLRPDLVILPVDKIQTQAELSRLGLTVMTVDTRTLNGLLSALAELGKATNREKESDLAIDRIEDAIEAAKANAMGKSKPKVLFSVMHSYAGLGYISEITAAGNDGFFSYLIEICGGTNAYDGALSFPSLSREALFKLNPDVIIDLLRSESDVEQTRKDWQSLAGVNAVKNDRLYLFTDESDTVPGPRAYLTIKKVSEAIHPPGEKPRKDV